MTEGLINKLANDTGRHPAAMVEAGVRAFLQNMYDRGLSSQDFNLRCGLSSTVHFQYCTCAWYSKNFQKKFFFLTTHIFTTLKLQ